MSSKEAEMGHTSRGMAFLSKYYFPISLSTILLICAVCVYSFNLEGPREGVPQTTIVLVSVLFITGFFAGLLGGWIGTGGCSIMLPILHFYLGFSAPLAVGTTLFAVIFTTLSGGFVHFKNKNVDRRTTMWMGIGGVIGVIIGSWLFIYLSRQSAVLALIIGIVFIWPALRMAYEGLMPYLKKSSAAPGGQPQENIIKGSPAKLSIFGVIVGIATGLVGLGGGYAIVPGLIYLFGAPVYLTMGTSLAVMLPMAAIGGSIKLYQGYVVLIAGLILAAGTAIGAQVGAATIKKIKPNVLKLMFGVYFLYVALKFIFSYIGVMIW
jgi:uncharacterized membrane protein YfcA